MTVFRSALFACALVAAGSACRRRAEVNPEVDRVIRPAAGTSITATPIPQTYEATVPPAPGTAAPYGHGALGGAAIATQPLPPQGIAAEVTTPATESAVTVDRQGRSITVRRRTTTPPADTSNRDSQEQGIGGGDTYDRNR